MICVMGNWNLMSQQTNAPSLVPHAVQHCKESTVKLEISPAKENYNNTTLKNLLLPLVTG